MENEFVSYTQALALKELGFDEPCFGYYYHENYFTKCTPQIYYSNSFTECDSDSVVPSNSCKAPLYQQAFRWFREKYNFDVGTAKDSHDIYHFQIDTNNYGNWILLIF